MLQTPVMLSLVQIGSFYEKNTFFDLKEFFFYIFFYHKAHFNEKNAFLTLKRCFFVNFHKQIQTTWKA